MADMDLLHIQVMDRQINAQMLAEGYVYDDDLGLARGLGDERYLVDPIDVLFQLLHHLGIYNEEQVEALSNAIPDATRTAAQRQEAQKIIKQLQGLPSNVPLEPRDIGQFHRKDKPDSSGSSISVHGGRRKRKRKKTRKKRTNHRKKRTRRRR